MARRPASQPITDRRGLPPALGESRAWTSTSTAGVALPDLPLRVNRLGVSTRSKKVAVNSAVAQDDLLVPAANGYAQTLPAAAGTYWVIGSAEQAGTAGVVEFIGCLPYKIVVS